jgi:hypothetical protein
MCALLPAGGIREQSVALYSDYRESKTHVPHEYGSAEYIAQNGGKSVFGIATESIMHEPMHSTDGIVHTQQSDECEQVDDCSAKKILYVRTIEAEQPEYNPLKLFFGHGQLFPYQDASSTRCREQKS